MYKVLIADDERIVLNSFTTIIPWKELGLEVVCTAENGADAYIATLDNIPDIIITDINMPLLSGLELIEKIRALNKDSEIIIISGFSEFAYAQKAIRFGVRQYLLKPTRKEEIIDALKESIKALDEKNVRKEKERKQILKSFRFHIAKACISDMVMNIDKFDDAYCKAIKELDLEKVEAAMLYSLETERNTNIRSCALAIHRHIKQNNIMPVLPTLFASGKFYLMFDSADADKVFRFESEMNIDNYGIINRSRYETDLKNSVYHLVYSIYTSREIQIFDSSSRLELLYNESSSFNRLKAITSICNQMEKPLAREEIKSVFSTGDIPEAKALLLMLYTMIQNEEPTLSILNIARNITTEQEAAEYAMKLLDMQRPSDAMSYPVKTLQQYIKDHFSDENISLKYIADNVLFMNVGYLSRLFVKETGIKFSDYLNSMRIAKAKDLMSIYPNMSIAEVAELVGFSDNPRYFSQVFKKYTGSKPSEWEKTKE